AVSIVLFVVVRMAIALLAHSAAPAAAVPATLSEPAQVTELMPAELVLVSQTLMGRWGSSHELLPDTQNGWTASSAVYSGQDGKLYLFTNRHCLALDSLASSAYDNSPAVSGYQLTVVFPNGQQRQVLRFAYQSSNVDLALL